MPMPSSLRASAGPTPGSRRTGSGASKAAASAAPITAKPRGLLRSTAIFASSRFGARPIETVTPTVALDLEGEAGEHGGGRRAVQRLGAGEIEHRLVDRQRLDQRREAFHQRADLPRGSGVFGEVGADDHGVRAGLQRLEHRHGAAHAGQPGDVAGGADHAARAAADDHRAGRQLRPVALLDAGVERVAVDMGDREGQQLGMRHHPPAAALRTSDRRRLTNDH